MSEILQHIEYTDAATNDCSTCQDPLESDGSYPFVSVMSLTELSHTEFLSVLHYFLFIYGRGFLFSFLLVTNTSEFTVTTRQIYLVPVKSESFILYVKLTSKYYSNFILSI